MHPLGPDTHHPSHIFCRSKSARCSSLASCCLLAYYVARISRSFIASSLSRELPSLILRAAPSKRLAVAVVVAGRSRGGRRSLLARCSNYRSGGVNDRTWCHVGGAGEQHYFPRAQPVLRAADTGSDFGRVVHHPKYRANVGGM